nr:hypothetical protein CFP56_44943 [Quercus suber]
MESSYCARLRRRMILASRRNCNYPTNIHALATQRISTDLQLNRAIPSLLFNNKQFRSLTSRKEKTLQQCKLLQRWKPLFVLCNRRFRNYPVSASQQQTFQKVFLINIAG